MYLKPPSSSVSHHPPSHLLSVATPVRPAPSVPRTGSTASNRNTLSLPLLVFTGLCLVQVPGGSSGDRGWPGPGRPPWGMGWGRGARGVPALQGCERTGPPRRPARVALPRRPAFERWCGPSTLGRPSSCSRAPVHSRWAFSHCADLEGLGCPLRPPWSAERQAWPALSRVREISPMHTEGGVLWGVLGGPLNVPVNLHVHTSCLQIKPMPVGWWFQTGIQLLAPSKL